MLRAVLAPLVQRPSFLSLLCKLLLFLLHPCVPPLALLLELDVGGQLLRKGLLALPLCQAGAVELAGALYDGTPLEVLRDLGTVKRLRHNRSLTLAIG